MDESIKPFAAILDSFKSERMESKGKRRGRKPGRRGGGGGGKRNPIGVIPYDEEDGIDLSLFNEGGVPGIDILATKDTSQDGLPEDEGKGGGEDIWFWRTLFQFRLPPYLQATEGQIQ